MGRRIGRVDRGWRCRAIPSSQAAGRCFSEALSASLTGALAGEFGDLHPAEFSSRSVVGLAYLVVFGSWLAFTAYAWLLQNAPVSRVATYAYVNPVVAIALGWAILDEAVTPVTFAGAAIIVASVAAVVRTESRRSNSLEW